MMIATRPFVTDPDEIRSPDQILIRTADPDWSLLEPGQPSDVPAEEDE